MKEDISSMKSDIMAMKNEIRTISCLNESMRDDFSSAENIIYDKIEEHDNQITAELRRMNQTLTREIFFIILRKHVEVHRVGDVQSTWI